MSDDDIMKVFISHKSKKSNFWRFSESAKLWLHSGDLIHSEQSKNKFNTEHQNFIYAMAEKSIGILQDLHSL